LGHAGKKEFEKKTKWIDPTINFMNSSALGPYTRKTSTTKEN
jgi:hypothetical protein